MFILTVIELLYARGSFRVGQDQYKKEMWTRSNQHLNGKETRLWWKTEQYRCMWKYNTGTWVWERSTGEVAALGYERGGWKQSLLEGQWGGYTQGCKVSSIQIVYLLTVGLLKMLSFPPVPPVHNASCPRGWMDCAKHAGLPMLPLLPTFSFVPKGQVTP